MLITRRVLLAGLAALLAAACGDARPTEPLDPSGPSFSRVTTGATFDWTVPDRYGADADGDGLIDYPRSIEARQPSVFPVDFDACELVGTFYHWFIDRRPVAEVSTCEYRHMFDDEGVYDVAVHVTDDDDASYWAEDVVTVQDWLIVSFGDSYASGEGVPEVPQANTELIQSLEGLFADLQAARAHREAARASLADALEAKGLAEDILQTARDRRAAFQAACSDIDGWSDVQACKDFLVDRALSFELFSDASAHFQQAVDNAQERVDDATTAFNEAQNAVDAAVSAVANLRAAIEVARTGFTEPQWQPRFEVRGDNFKGGDDKAYECHRSALAAPSRAALALEREDPKTSVTFVHVACSGARIQTDHGPMDQQVPLAETLVGNREIDAVLLSIGGNDAGFADIATGCAVQEHCFDLEPVLDLAAGTQICPFVALVGSGDVCTGIFGALPDRSARQVLDAGLAVLPDRYEHLATQLFPGLSGLLAPEAGGPGRDGRGRPAPALEPVDRLRSERVYITEYVDMTRGDDGDFCEFERSNRLGAMPGFTELELLWLDVTAAGGINNAVETAAATHGWNRVGGIYAGYRTHGYCADDHWVVRGHETFLIQGDISGIAHPNVQGHAFNGSVIHAALIQDLYPDGLDGAPRAPDQPRTPATFAGSVR